MTVLEDRERLFADPAPIGTVRVRHDDRHVVGIPIWRKIDKMSWPPRHLHPTALDFLELVSIRSTDYQTCTRKS